MKSIAFYQPVIDIDARDRKNVKKNDGHKIHSNDKEAKSFLDVATEIANEECLKIHFKTRDGVWSQPAMIPINGAGHGIVKMYSSRWPEITKKLSPRKRRRKGADIVSNGLAAGTKAPSKVKFSSSCLSPSCYELSYQVSVIGGPWGEFSRLLLLNPRFILRNDSNVWHLDVKQVGTSDSTLIHLACETSVPFYWADSNLPELICVRPVQMDQYGTTLHHYQWSGGMDIRTLGMTPLRIRKEEKKSKEKKMFGDELHDVKEQSFIRVIRSLIEIRSGTGGTGITVSFKEEFPNGEDSLYRIENHSPFLLWIAQDGLLANPQYDKGLIVSEGQSEYHGDLIVPGEKVSFGLDVPFRQGKHSGQRALTLEELLNIRIALAPLFTRDGIETMKVVGLSIVGSTFRLKPSNLRSFFGEDLLSEMMNICVQGTVCADGPTRVLRFM